MKTFVLALLLSCVAELSFAKTFPGQWDGSCIALPPINENNKHNPDVWQGRGYIPPGMPETTEDIQTCLLPPANGMGPK